MTEEVATQEIKIHETSTSMVQAAFAELDACTDIRLKVKVSCPEWCNLQGSTVKIIAQDDVLKEIELTEFDGAANETDEFVVKGPFRPGAYTWTAVFPEQETEGVLHKESAEPFSFVVKPHAIGIAVWGVPSPVTKGKEFTVKIGAKCSAGCSLAGLPFEIDDGNGVTVATGKLGEMALPQTDGLCWSEQELAAPAEEGQYTWVARCPAPDLELPHQVIPNRFTFRAARPPDHIVTVEVVDERTKAPIKKAGLFLNLRSASTDESGVAKIEVTKGRHVLYVSMHEYDDFQTNIEVAGDVTVQVEMIPVLDAGGWG